MAEPSIRQPVEEQLMAMWLATTAPHIGAPAYSQGLEQAVEMGWVHDSATCQAWAAGVLGHAVARFDLPLLARLWVAWAEDDRLAARHLDARVLAGRESAELQAAERDLGSALLGLLEEPPAEDGSHVPLPDPDVSYSYLGAFALAAVRLGLGQSAMLVSYCFAWVQHAINAATHILPLDQAEAQAVFRACLRLVPEVMALARAIPDDEIGAATPGLAIASARHETRVRPHFRS